MSRAVLLDEKRWNRVGNDFVPDIQFSFDGKVGMAGSTFPYRVRGMWGDMRSDVFVVDARTGKWTLVKRAMEPSRWASPFTHARLPVGSIPLA